MVDSTTQALFAELQKLLPGLPEHVTQLEFRMSVGSCPVVTCQFQVRKAGKVSTDRKTFAITEMIKKGEVGNDT